MQVVIRVDNLVRLDYRQLKKHDSFLIKWLKKRFTYENPTFIKTQRLGYPTYNIPEKIKSYKLIGKNIVFNRGCLRTIKTVLKKRNVNFKIIDDSFIFPPETFNSKIKLRPEQIPMVNAMLKYKQGYAIARCSSGKTIMLLEAIARAKQPACIIVWDTNLQKQWFKEATNPNLLNMKDHEIGGVGGIFKKRKFGKLNICMQQSLYKKNNREFFAYQCGFVACDEIQRGATRTYQEVLKDFASTYRIGVTADEKRTDKKEFLIYDSFGNNPIYVMPSSDARNVKPAKIFLIKTNYKNDDYEMTLRSPELLNDMSEDEKRNNIIVKRAIKKFKNNKIVLILVERKKQALILDNILSQYGYIGRLLVGLTTKKEIEKSDWPDEWITKMRSYDPLKESEQLIKMALDKKLNYVIATQKGNVGLSIRTLDHAIVTTPTNIKLFNQKKGRVERDYDESLIKKFGNKKTPSIDYLWDYKINPLKNKGYDIMNNFSNVKIIN